MNKTAIALGLAAALIMPMAAEAKTVTLTTTMATYSGNGAYLAIYLTDAQGKFHSTLHVAAPKAKYHRHLRDWARGNATTKQRLDGLTGASVGSGKTHKVSVDIADALLEAGYQIRIDSAVEDQRDNAADVVATLASAGAAKPIAGKGYVKSFRFDM
jgi:hypothetical protein